MISENPKLSIGCISESTKPFSSPPNNYSESDPPDRGYNQGGQPKPAPISIVAHLPVLFSSDRIDFSVLGDGAIIKNKKYQRHYNTPEQ